MDAADKEIQALIALLDDSDNEVFDHVAQRLYSYGPQIIGKLEDAYTTIPDRLTLERIEGIIKHIQFTSVEKDFRNWILSGSDDLLKGVLIINRHRYPELNESEIIAQIHKIRKDIWLGLNHYLSPLEQVNVVNRVLFGQMQFTGNADPAEDLFLSYFHKMLDKQKGNHFSIGLLYLILCQQLEMPVYGVCLTSHFILTRCKEYIIDFSDSESMRREVLFYINPFNKGLAFGEKEITAYLNKVDIAADQKYFLPASNKAVLNEYLTVLQNLYVKSGEKNYMHELDALKMLLDE